MVNTTLTCHACNSSSTLNASTGKCDPCANVSDNCSECSGLKCSKCLDGFYQAGNGSCVACD